MKRYVLSLLAALMVLGQAPAWAMACGMRCNSAPSLACIKLCAKSAALLTQDGALPSIGKACGTVQLRTNPLGLTAADVVAPAAPSNNLDLQAAVVSVQAPAFAVIKAAHAPPTWILNAQALLSVPTAQAPPTRA